MYLSFSNISKSSSVVPYGISWPICSRLFLPMSLTWMRGASFFFPPHYTQHTLGTCRFFCFNHNTSLSATFSRLFVSSSISNCPFSVLVCSGVCSPSLDGPGGIVCSPSCSRMHLFSFLVKSIMYFDFLSFFCRYYWYLNVPITN